MRLLIFGPMASGKGTQAAKIAKHFNIPHISTGDIFRANIVQKTELGKLAVSLINDGILIPDNITNNLVKNRLTEKDCKEGFVLDGYPRTMNQAEFLDELPYEIDAAINFEVSHEEIIKRASNRRVCANCKANFNLVYIPPKEEGKCDKCGGKLVQRDDDKPESIEKRLNIYHNQIGPLTTFYKQKNIWIDINGEQTIEEVFKAALSAL